VTHTPPRRTVAFAAALLFALAPALAAAAAPEASSHHADIRKLMKLTGAGELGIQAMQQMMPAMRQMVPEAPEAFWAEFSSKFHPGELVEMVVPIYAKHLTPKDVKDLIAFFESPAGRKLSSVQPAIMQESMAAGQAWGQRVAGEILRKAQERGFKVKT